MLPETTFDGLIAFVSTGSLLINPLLLPLSGSFTLCNSCRSSKACKASWCSVSSARQGFSSTVSTRSANRQKEWKQIHKIAVRLYNLGESVHEQLNLFDDDHSTQRKVMDSADRINLKYGRHAIYMANMHASVGRIDDSISFGSTGDVHQLMEELNSFEAFDDMEEDVFFQDGFPLETVRDIPIRSRTDMGKIEI